MTHVEAGKLGYLKSVKAMEENRKERKRLAQEKYSKNIKKCKECHSNISYEKRENAFCGSRCSAVWNNRHGYTGKRTGRTSKKCKACGGIPKRYSRGRYGSFCLSCMAKGLHRQKALLLSDAKTDATRRRILLRDRGHKCQKCTRKEWEGAPIPIELHHIDGNSDNNTPDNLMLICLNCHGQTPNYRNTNGGNGLSTRNIGRRSRYEKQVVLTTSHPVIQCQ